MSTLTKEEEEKGQWLIEVLLAIFKTTADVGGGLFVTLGQSVCLVKGARLSRGIELCTLPKYPNKQNALVIVELLDDNPLYDPQYEFYVREYTEEVEDEITVSYTKISLRQALDLGITPEDILRNLAERSCRQAGSYASREECCTKAEVGAEMGLLQLQAIGLKFSTGES